MSNNTGHTQVTPNQNNKEVTINDALGRLDAALTEQFDADVSAGNVSLSNAQFQQAIRVNATGAATGGRTVTVPAIKHLFVAANASATHAVAFVRGSTSISVAPETQVLMYADGTTDGLFVNSADVAWTALDNGPGAFTGQAKETVRVNSGETAMEYVPISYDIGLFLPGVPVAASQVTFVCARAFTLADDFASSRGYAATPDTTGAIFNVLKNGSPIGAITFSAASNTATFATSGSGLETFAAGDRLTIEADTIDDIADVSITFIGTRND